MSHIPFQFRRDTAANWTANDPVLEEGEYGYETDDLGTAAPKYKVGDGVTAWTALPYITGGGTGDVVGPASAAADRVAVFDGITGKLIKDGGKTIAVILSDAATAADALDAARLVSTITNGDTTHAPTGDAVFVALALKSNLVSPTFTGDHVVSEADFLTGTISPAQITANTNDWAPTGFSTCSQVRFSTDQARKFTGLAGAAAGRIVTFHNIGAKDALFSNEDTGSTAANRFAIGRSIIVQPGHSIRFWYDTTSSRWRDIAGVTRTCINVLGADVINNNAVANTLQDVTGLSFEVLNGIRYLARFWCTYNASSSANGSRWSALGPTTSEIVGRGYWNGNASGNQNITNMTANTWDSGQGVSATSFSNASGNIAVLDIVFVPTADGTVVMRFAAEEAGNAITARGSRSFVQYEALN